MKNLIILSILFIIQLNNFYYVHSFLSFDLKTQFPELFLQPLKSRAGGTADVSLSHQRILKLGVLRAIARYLQDHNYECELNLNDLGQDVYKSNLLNNEPGLKKVIQTMELAVVSVDSDPKTANLVTAHFEAEQFQQANNRIRKIREEILAAIGKKNYEEARILIGQILHPIQDFYSHTNWIEMGNTDINYGIGYDVKDYGVPIASPTEPTCVANCDVVLVFCTPDVLELVRRAREFLGNLPDVPCPIPYFKCYTNVITSKLTSVFYPGDVDEDGKPVIKPAGKCNHGGIFGNDTAVPPLGGINKDASFFIIGSHANLHIKAGLLAIRHSEYFINWIRHNISDESFRKLFNLNQRKYE